MQKIIPIVKAESLIPFGEHCYEVAPARAPKPCPFFGAARSPGAKHRTAYCSYLRTDVPADPQRRKHCDVRLSAEAPPSPTAYAKVFGTAQA